MFQMSKPTVNAPGANPSKQYRAPASAADNRNVLQILKDSGLAGDDNQWTLDELQTFKSDVRQHLRPGEDLAKVAGVVRHVINQFEYTVDGDDEDREQLNETELINRINSYDPDWRNRRR
jgi:hypothetical protein